MEFTFENARVPLRQEESGAIRVGDTRVLLDLVIGAFNRGSTCEEIVFQYSTLNLIDVYAVVAWYLQNRQAVDAYLVKNEEEAAVLRKKIEARFPKAGIRERLLKRREEMKLTA